MIRKEIFNKYCLNNIIGDFATQHHSEINPSLCNIVQGTIVAAAIINEIIAVIIAKYAFIWAGEIDR